MAVRDEKGTEVQKLVCRLLPDAAEATVEELAAVRQQFVTHFVIADLDFDGHLDLAGIREFGAKWARYCVWLYDQKQHRYTKDFLAEQMELLTNLKPLGDSQISGSHIGPANSWIAVYRVVGSDGSWPVRQLVPVRSCLVESTLDGEKPTALVTTQLEGEQTVVHRQHAAKMDVKSALDKCSLGALNGTTPEVLSLNRTNDGDGLRLGLPKRQSLPCKPSAAANTANRKFLPRQFDLRVAPFRQCRTQGALRKSTVS